MRKKPRNSWRSSLKSSRRLEILRGLIPVIALALIVCMTACAGGDPKVLVEKTLDAREKAFKEQDINTYMKLVSDDYVYKEGAKGTIREYLEENLAPWDEVDIRTYNRVITFKEKNQFAEVHQDFQMSVTRGGKTKVFDGAEFFMLMREGGLFPSYKFISGLD